MTQATATVIHLRNGGLPAELAPLTDVEQWLIYRIEQGTKVPYQAARPRLHAKHTEPETWSDYETARRAYRRGEGEGLGFALMGSGFAALDLDDVRNPKTGELLSWAQEQIDECDSYAEVSPSGTGVHIIGRAKGPREWTKWGMPGGSKLERFRDAAYISITGEMLHRAPLRNIDRQIDALKRPTKGSIPSGDGSGSGVFFKRVLEMAGRGKTLDQIEAYIVKHPHLFSARNKRTGKPGGALRFIAGRRLREEIERICEKEGITLRTRKLSTKHLTADMVTPEEVEWSWFPRIPAGAITLIGAKGKTGKGIMCADLAARTTRGWEWPLSKERAPKGTVLWCETEDSFKRVVVPRLIAADANLSKVILKKPREFFELELAEFIQEQGTRLIVLSPLNSFLEMLKEPNSGMDVRQALENIQSAIEDTQCAVAGICHLNKKVDVDAVERLLGSVEYGNFARSIILLAKEGDEVRVAHARVNFADTADDLLFTIHNKKPRSSPRGQYIAADWAKAAENVDHERMFDRKPEIDTKSAGDWLVEYLRKRGPTLCTKIFADAEAYGHKEDALKQAKQRRRSEIEHTQAGSRKTMKWRLKGG